MGKTIPVEVRFWAKVDKNGPIAKNRPDLGRCHEWLASKDERGYGRFAITKSKLIRAHQFAWVLKNGPVPEGLELDHFACDYPGCCNDEHVRPVTHKQNMEHAYFATKPTCGQGHPFDDENTYWWRGTRKCRECRAASARRTKAERRLPRKTHCVNGHPFDEENTHINKRGGRECRTCHRDRERERWRAAQARKVRGEPAATPAPPLTHCRRGHPFDEENIPPTGPRQCKTCRRERQRARVIKAGGTPRTPRSSRPTCRHGHDEANTYISLSGERSCRTCARDRKREREAAKRSEGVMPNGS